MFRRIGYFFAIIHHMYMYTEGKKEANILFERILNMLNAVTQCLQARHCSFCFRKKYFYGISFSQIRVTISFPFNQIAPGPDF